MALLGSFQPSTVLTPPFIPLKSSTQSLIIKNEAEGDNCDRMVNQAQAPQQIMGGMETQAAQAADPLKALIQRYKQLANHELYLVAQLKEQNPRSPVGQQLGRQLQLVLAQKMREVNSLVGDLQAKEVKSTEPVLVASIASARTPPPALEIIEQPLGNVVANKYLEPSIVLKIAEEYLPLAQDSRLQVSASLTLALGDKKISRTLDDKQDILQGHVCVLVSCNGLVTFNKLKIMEVSSKYQHQAFCINFQLEEIKANTVLSPLGVAIKSTPLHVQSRVNKRKKKVVEGIETSSDPTPTKKHKREPSLSRSTDSVTDELPTTPSGISTRSSLRNSLGTGPSLRNSVDESPRPSSLRSSFGNYLSGDDASADLTPSVATVVSDFSSGISTRSRTREKLTQSQNELL